MTDLLMEKIRFIMHGLVIQILAKGKKNIGS
jgi:hypothetical protein